MEGAPPSLTTAPGELRAVREGPALVTGVTPGRTSGTGALPPLGPPSLGLGIDPQTISSLPSGPVPAVPSPRPPACCPLCALAGAHTHGAPTRPTQHRHLLHTLTTSHRLSGGAPPRPHTHRPMSEQTLESAATAAWAKAWGPQGAWWRERTRVAGTMMARANPSPSSTRPTAAPGPRAMALQPRGGREGGQGADRPVDRQTQRQLRGWMDRQRPDGLPDDGLDE